MNWLKERAGILLALAKNGVFLALLVFIVLYQGGVFATDKTPPGYTVIGGQVVRGEGLVEVTKVELDELYEESALVTTRHQADISPRVMGVILEILPELGALVKKDDPLVRINDDSMGVRLEQARRGLAGAQSGVKRAEEGETGARAALVQAEKNYERTREFARKQAATTQQLEAAEAAYRQAKAAAAAAGEGVAMARAEVEKARKFIEEAEIGVGFTLLKAPFDGIVSARHADPGDMAVPGKPVLRINDIAEFQLEAHLRESARASVKPGQEIAIAIGDKPGRGKIEEISPRVDPMTRTFEIKVGFKAEGETLLGMFGRVYIPTGKRSATLVPSAAVARVGQLSTVLVQKAGLLERRYIKVSPSDREGMLEVRTGLEGSEKVLLAPQVQ